MRKISEKNILLTKPQRFFLITLQGRKKVVDSVNETISKHVHEYWDAAKYYTNCSDSCKEIVVSTIWIKNKDEQDSQVKFYFYNRVKVVKSYYAYSGLSLIAEIGGYIGLFLGVSFNQITHLTTFVQERIQKYL